MATQHIPAVGSHVILAGGKKSGTVSSLMAADGGESVTGFVVHFGWRKRKAKVVPIADVKWVNDDSVVLTLSRKQFASLADWAPPASSGAAETNPAAASAARKPAHS